MFSPPSHLTTVVLERTPSYSGGTAEDFNFIPYSPYSKGTNKGYKLFNYTMIITDFGANQNPS